MKRKKLRMPRMLYAQSHEMLGDIQIPLLMQAGFEIVRPFSHILCKAEWSTPVKKIDNPYSEVNQLWKNQCTLDPITLNAIQKIDIFCLSQLPFTVTKKPDFSTTNNSNLTEIEKQLINDNIDVIFVVPFPSVACHLLSWFKGVVVFYIYGNDGNIPTLDSDELSNPKCIKALFFSSLEKLESSYLGNSYLTLIGDIGLEIRKKISHKWLEDKSNKVIGISTTYIHKHFLAQQAYLKFKEYFDDVDYVGYGKVEPCIYTEQDSKIKLRIDNYDEYLSRYCECRVFVYTGTSPTHTRYTPFENIAMGVPTLFLQNTGIGTEAELVLGEEARKAGMCKDYSDMKERAVRCLEDIEYAKDLAKNNQIILDEVFSEERFCNQAKELYSMCQNILTREFLLSQPEINNRQFYLDQKSFIEPIERKQTRILWGFVHTSARNDELPRFFKAGFEVVPIKMLDILKEYEGTSYDDETRFDYPKWRENCTLPKSIAERIRAIKIYSTPHEFGDITKEDIKILNQYIGIIYVCASVNVSLKLLEMGYKGIILFRYYGHYMSGVNGVNHVNPPQSSITKLSTYQNILYCPAMHSLIQYEDPLIGRKDKMAYIGYLTRKKSDFAKFIWKGKESKPVLGNVISMAATHLFHYYSNFIKHFGHLPYKIFGKNTKAELQSKTLVDDGIVGQLKNASDVYEQMSRCRVYVEPGLVAHHCHYTPIEAIAMEMPVIFWAGSGLANEAMVKFSAAELFEMGMCATWDEMSVMAEKCLADVDFAIELAKRQRPLENIVTEDDIIAEMLKFKEQIPTVLDKIKHQNHITAIKSLILSTSLFFKKIRNIHISLVSIKILKYVLFTKRKIKKQIDTIIPQNYGYIRKKNKKSYSFTSFNSKLHRKLNIKFKLPKIRVPLSLRIVGKILTGNKRDQQEMLNKIKQMRKQNKKSILL